MLWKRYDRKGLTAIEYGVFAAFIVLMLVGAAVVIGPKLSDWLTGTISCITNRQAKDSSCT